MESQIETVQPGQFVLDDNRDYIQVSAGEPLEFHISAIEVTKTPKFESEELEDKLVIRFKLDSDVEGKGQVYTSWFRPSLNPKSNMYKLLIAVYSNNIPIPLDVTALRGRPLRATLTEGKEKNGKVRQYLETFLKPGSHQKIVEFDAVPTDLPELDVDAMFGDDSGA